MNAANPRKRRGRPQKRLNRRRRQSKRRQLFASEQTGDYDLNVAQPLERQDPESPSFYSAGIPKERIPEFPPQFSPLAPPRLGSQTFTIPALTQAPTESLPAAAELFGTLESPDRDILIIPLDGSLESFSPSPRKSPSRVRRVLFENLACA